LCVQAKLAAFTQDCLISQIEISKTYAYSQWQEDLRKLIAKATTAPQHVVFLLSDTQLKSELFVEDISNLLNTAEVPNLMGPADLTQMYEIIRPQAKTAGMDGSIETLHAFFLQQVKAKLHVVIAMSYAGDAFRDRLRKFPALVNCTTIDWFTPWPEDALSTVAMHFPADIPGIPPDTAYALPSLCVKLHQVAKEVTDDFCTRERRHLHHSNVLFRAASCIQVSA
jgi:dynein heavy chain, axonemal